MGTYINRGNNEFRDIVAHEYVDKSSLIPLINATLNSEFRYSCVTRCRRFGTSMAAKMLCAYYDKSCDSRALFAGLEAEKDIVKLIQHDVMEEVLGLFPDIVAKERDD